MFYHKLSFLKESISSYLKLKQIFIFFPIATEWILMYYDIQSLCVCDWMWVFLCMCLWKVENGIVFMNIAHLFWDKFSGLPGSHKSVKLGWSASPQYPFHSSALGLSARAKTPTILHKILVWTEIPGLTQHAFFQKSHLHSLGLCFQTDNCSSLWNWQ